MMADRNQRYQTVTEMRRAIEMLAAPAPVSKNSSQMAGESGAEGGSPIATSMLRRPVTPPNTRRVLLLEDDVLVRDIMRRYLELAGFQVCETAEGRETIHKYEEAMRSGKPFDLVIMDLTIPDGLSGAETIHYLRSMDPRLVAVVSSGYKDDPIMRNPAQHGFVAALPKPYQREALLQLVNGVLAAHGRAA